MLCGWKEVTTSLVLHRPWVTDNSRILIYGLTAFVWEMSTPWMWASTLPLSELELSTVGQDVIHQVIRQLLKGLSSSCCTRYFSASTLSVRWKEGHLACKNCRFAGSNDLPVFEFRLLPSAATSIISYSSRICNNLTFCY